MSDEFDWAAGEETDTVAKEEGSKLKKAFTPDAEHRPAMKSRGLPSLTFDLTVGEEEFKITTDYAPLFATAFNTPAEIDQHILTLKHFRAVVYEAYLQARDRLRVAQSEFENLKATLRRDVLDAAKVVEEGKKPEKMTIADIDAAILFKYGKTLQEGEGKVEQAKANVDRLLELHYSVCQRAKELSEIAGRFSRTPADYDAVFNE